jgi:hypothetical protein
MANTFKQLREKVLPGQLDRLKKAYEPLRKSDMSKHTDAIKQATAMLNRLSQPGTLVQLSKADIPVVSDVAKNLMKRRGITEDWKDELKNQGNVRVGKTDSKGNWHSVSTSDKKEIEKLKSQGYEVVKEADLSKTQIKMVHKQADELPKNDFIKRYGKDGDAVRFATATNQVKKKLGIEEGTWALPTTSKQANQLRKLLKKPLRADVALDKLTDSIGGYTLIGDDELFDDLEDMKRKSPKTDVRHIIVDRLKQLGFKSFSAESIGEEGFKSDAQRQAAVASLYSKLGLKGASKRSREKDKGKKKEEVELTEAVSDRQVAKIKRMTSNNDHFGARFELARLMKDKQLMGFYDSLEKMHRTLPPNIIGNDAIKLRGRLERVLRDRLKSKFKADADRLVDEL